MASKDSISSDELFGGKAPHFVKVLILISFIAFWVHIAVLWSFSFWARRSPDWDHTYAIRTGGASSYYFVPVVGRLIEFSGLLIFTSFAFVLVFGLFYSLRKRPKSRSR